MFEFLQAAVVWWSIPFFILWGVALFICFVSAMANKYWVTGVVFMSILAFVQFSGAADVFGFIGEHYWITLSIVIGYFAAALVWMTVRWIRYTERVGDKRAAKIAEYFRSSFEADVTTKIQDAERELREEAFENERQALEAKGEDVEAYKLTHKRDRIRFTPSDEDKKTALEGKIAEAKKKIKAEAEAWEAVVLASSVAPNEPTWLNDRLNCHALTEYGSSEDDYLGKANAIPTFRECKRRFFVYFFYWPIDLPIYFFGIFLKDLWRTVVKFVQKYYDWYARKRIIRKIEL